MWKAITSFFPGGQTSTGNVSSGKFTSAVPSAYTLPVIPKMGSIQSANIKEGVNYAEPSNEEVYNLRISKPKFNAGDENPFFVNIPAKKYKVFVSDDPDVKPSEEVKDSTLRFYGSSAQNIYKKAKTYKASAKVKHNALFKKAQTNYYTRATQKVKEAGEQLSQKMQEKTKLETSFRSEIENLNTALNEQLTNLDQAQKKIMPATRFTRSRAMTNAEQKTEIRRIRQRITSYTEEAQALQKRMSQVSGLPADIQTALQEFMERNKKASALLDSISPPANEAVKRSNISNAGIAKLQASAAMNKERRNSKAGTAGVSNKGKEYFRKLMTQKPALPSENILGSAKESEEILARVAANRAKREAAAGQQPVTGANATTAPPPIQIPANTSQSTGFTPKGPTRKAKATVLPPIVPGRNASVPQPRAAQPPPAPAQNNSPWLGGGSRKRKHARSAKRKTGKSRKY